MVHRGKANASKSTGETRAQQETLALPMSDHVRVDHSEMFGQGEAGDILKNDGAFGPVLFIQRFNVVNANPCPRSGLALAATGHIDCGVVSCYAREVAAGPLGVS